MTEQSYEYNFKDMPQKSEQNNQKENLSKSTIPQTKCIAIIGDIVGSRNLGTQRPIVQSKLFKFLVELNRKYSHAIISKFVVTTGDEFQGLIKQSEVLPDLIWEMEIYFLYEIRLGIGCGTLNTELKKTAIGMDGPAWYLARDAIKDAHMNKRLGGVFKGFSDTDDFVLNGFARILHYYRERLTKKQIKIINMLKSGLNQMEIADELKITKQAVSNHVISAGWSAYDEAECGWKKILKIYDFTEEW